MEVMGNKILGGLVWDRKKVGLNEQAVNRSNDTFLKIITTERSGRNVFGELKGYLKKKNGLGLLDPVSCYSFQI